MSYSRKAIAGSVIAFTIACAATAASYGPPPMPPPQVLVLADANGNGDGFVSFEELQVILPDLIEDIFDLWDTDGDGFLPVPEPPAIPADPLLAILTVIHLADANDDGVVTPAEAEAAFPQVYAILLDQWDLNGDGVVSFADLTELPPEYLFERLRAILAHADGNSDGTVTPDEFVAAFPDIPVVVFHILDRNDDGALTREDLPLLPPEHFLLRLLELIHMADANEDGEVTYAEALAVIADLTEDAFAHLDRNDDGVLSREDLPPEPILLLASLLEGADANGDGVVTPDEALAAIPDLPPELFALLDRNGDGMLSAEDLPPLPHEEYVLRLFELIANADSDGDGVVTYEEAVDFVPQLTLEQFDHMDFNDDGVLSREDLPPPPPHDPVQRLIHVIRTADADGDGA
ncbi:MAG TPA: hypothetical protein HPP83_08310, partial [Candidatus Hydrogenedentes bacterium]|nr:hypothetical protein [Candidatus Hydrogenedentota bacterium]